MSIIGEPLPGETPPTEGVLGRSINKHQLVESAASLACGTGTIDLLRRKIELIKLNYRGLLDSTLEQITEDLQRQPPQNPEPSLCQFFINAGYSPDKARIAALRLGQETFLRNKANAQAASDYFCVLNTPEANFEEISYLSEAIQTYVRQFSEMGGLLGIDLTQPSKLNPNLTIKQNYIENLTPVPIRLTPIFFEEGTRAIAHYSPEGSSNKGKWGSFFPFSAEYDGSIIRIKHDSDCSKIHEDSHFLAATIKGEERYYKDYRLGMIGEGLASIFEVWFAGSLQEGQNIPTENALRLLNEGRAPIRLRGSALDITDAEWWEEAKKRMAIGEHSEITKISAIIMSLIKENPDLTFPQLFKSFLEADTLEEFFEKIKVIGTVKIGVDKFKKIVTYLSGLARD